MRDAGNATEWQLVRAESLMLAFQYLALPSGKVTDGKCEMSALLTLMDALRKVFKQERDRHHAEWDAGKAP